MIGEGPRRPVLESRARDLPVVFTGHLHDRRELAGLLARADVALAPCPYETFGLAALEALACGTPVVAPDRGAVSELVQPGRRDAADARACGIATRSDSSSFADAVLDVLRAPADHRRHATRHRGEQYSWSRTANALMRIHRA
jgi:alpha-1,6-mannosyltransferase